MWKLISGMKGTSENLSYLVPRDPSIKSWSDRVKLQGPVTENLVKLGIEALDEPETEKLKVYLRIKPCEEVSSYSVLGNTLEVEAPKDHIAYKKLSKDVAKLVHKFNFSTIFNQNSSQENIFEKCVEDSLRRFLRGQNGLLFAYGTTNAGKTYTMQGTVESPGVIPRAIKYIFNSIQNNIEKFPQYQPCRYDDFCMLDDEELRKELVHKNFILNLDLTKYQRHPEVSYRSYKTETTKSSVELSEVYENVTFREMESNFLNIKTEVSNDRHAIWISMIEIHNEQIYDLLDIPDEKESRVKLGFAEDVNGKVYIKNMRYINVTNGHEAYQVFQFGKANLRLGPTALNNESSRSHCICTITLARFLEDELTAHAVFNRFSFCDLAGSERVKKALTQSHRLAESKAINTSLSIFNKCLNVIKENQTNREKKIVPYRESKLTRLFRDAMMGRQSFSIIVNITPEPHLFGETLSVLKFSAIAQQIVPVTFFQKPKRLLNIKKKMVDVANKRKDSETEWDSDDGADVKKIRKNTETFETLMDLVDRLKEEIAEERERANNIANKVRQELSMKFSEMIQSLLEKNNSIHESKIQKMQEGFDKKQKMLVEYYEKQKENSKKRRRDEDCCDYLEKGSRRIKILQKDIDILQSENESLRDLIQQLNFDNKKLQIRCTELEFDMSEKDRIVRSYIKTRESTSPDGDEFVKELQSQLQEYKSKIAELHTFLDKSEFEYKDLLVTNKCIREENEELVRALATTTGTVEDLKNDLQEYQGMLSMRNEKIEELENVIEEQHKMEVHHNRYKERLNQLQELLDKSEKDKLECIKELETLKEEVKELCECLNQTRKDNEGLKALINNMKEGGGAVRVKSEVLNDTNYLPNTDEKCNVDDINIGALKRENVSHLENDYIQQNEELQEEVPSLTREIIDANIKLENLSIEEGLQDKYEALMKEIENYKERNRHLENMVEEERRNLHEALRTQCATIDDLLKNPRTAEICAETTENAPPSPANEQTDCIEKERSYQDEINKYTQKIAYVIKRKNSEISKLREENERLLQEKSFVNETPEKIEPEINKVSVEHKCIQTEEEVEKTDEVIGSPRVDENDRESNGSPKEDDSRRLSRKIETLSVFYSEPKKSCKKMADNSSGIHPSLIKTCGRSRRKAKKGNENVEITNQDTEKEQQKCSKKLFADNDFDKVEDLDSSFNEPEIPRLRPRRKKIPPSSFAYF